MDAEDYWREAIQVFKLFRFHSSNGGGEYSAINGSSASFESDGSGSWSSYYGSYATLHSDGSGDYYAPDGSYATFSEDGCCSFTGSDGSWGSVDFTGEASYYAADGSYESFMVYFDNSISDAPCFQPKTLLGLGFHAALKAFERRMLSEASFYESLNAKEEEKETKDEKETDIVVTPPKKASLKDVIAGKAQSVGISSADCCSLDYRVLINRLQELGFRKIEVSSIEDLSYQQRSEKNKIERVYFNRVSEFSADTQFKYNTKIRIIYHDFEKRKPPLTGRKAARKNVNDVEAAFRSRGFENISIRPIYDLKKSIFTSNVKKDGMVDAVLVGGEDNYSVDDLFSVDTPVAITYHTIKSKKRSRSE